MPATFLDLLRAKVAIQLQLLDPAGARAGLTAVDAGTAGADGAGLLAYLGARGVSADASSRLDRHARRCVFLKGESFFLRELRARQLVEEERLQPILWEVRRQREGKGLGATLVGGGLIEPSLEEELSAAAQRACEADNEQITGRYRERGYEGIERSSQMVAQVIAEEEEEPAAGGPPAVGGEGTQVLPQSVAAGITPLSQQHLGGGVAVAPNTAQATAIPPRPGQMPSATPAASAGPAEEPPLPPELAGSGLDEKYVVLQKLGEGGMGVVYLAYERDDPERERPMALKVVRDIAKSRDAAARFKREILATSFCAHDNIIEIYDAAETADGSYYMAMEYIEGDELADLIKRDGPLKLPRLVDLLDQALEAMEAMHRSNIVHKDIKPQNFRITHDAQGREKLKVVDFGIARVLDAEDSGAGDQFYRTMGGKITGSPAYIAPESITEPEVDGRADLYSLGITIFRVATGRLPFVAKVPTEYLPMHLYNKPPLLREVLPEAPAELEQMVAKLLEKSPGKRYQTAGEALEFLRASVKPAVLGAAEGPAPAEEDEVTLALDEGDVTKAELTATRRLARPFRGSEGDAAADGGAEVTVETPPPASAHGWGDAAANGGDGAGRALDPLGFTNSEMAAVALSGEEQQAPIGGNDRLVPAPVQPELPKLGFFARLWAFFFGRKKKTTG